MLEITIPARELYDQLKQEFIEQPEVKLVLEHSLVSLSKWESKWEIPFLSDDPRTDEQTIDYIRMMDLSPDTPDHAFDRLTDEIIEQVSNYLNAKMTATWFNEPKKSSRRKEVITAEIIYHWMIALSIPFECQHWHLSRLLTLIKVCNEKNTPEKDRKKMSRSELAARNRSLNAKRRAQLKSSG